MPIWHGAASAANWEFDIDQYLNPLIPPSAVPWLPAPLAHFCGYRRPPSPRPIGNLIIILWAFLGVFCGVSLVLVVTAHIPAFCLDGAPVVIGSFGAAAVLEFYAIESPLAQPRSVFFGKVFSSIVGVAVTKLFLLAGPDRFNQLQWLAGSIACAAATAVMAITGTVNPPSGATALIAVTDEGIRAIGWYLVPSIMVGTILMQAAALLINNIQRQYPVYWWTPEETGQAWPCHRRWREQHDKKQRQHRHSSGDAASLEEEGAAGGGVHLEKPPSRGDEAGRAEEESDEPEPWRVTFTRTRSETGRTLRMGSHEQAQVIITRGRVSVPDSMYLRPEERLILEGLSERL
ncbi:HPP family protein [Niveomyces insectorum RCEF 264]|uniref:HPP family protein n=1 Tax=Niveomyces insectorum RCEF 264 TaxID=1081102 RepID=A0A167Y616_9HYPO|nr:HPP family protein [Niveomyces insectorum RCEF 264]